MNGVASARGVLGREICMGPTRCCMFPSLLTPAPDTLQLIVFGLCLGGGALGAFYISVGPDPWVVYSNLAFLMPVAAAVLRRRRWLLATLMLSVGAASTAYHQTTNLEPSSHSDATLHQLRQVDHVGALYASAVILTLPFASVGFDSRLADGVALVLAAGASVTAVWYTMSTDLEAVAAVAVALGTPIFSHWLQMVMAMARLRDWQVTLMWNLVLQALLPCSTGAVLGVLFAWNPYAVSATVAVALVWPFSMQCHLTQRSSQAWQSTSLAETLHLARDIYPIEGLAFILVALLLSLSALSLLWAPETADDWQWHGLWHILAAASGTFVIWNAPSWTGAGATGAASRTAYTGVEM